MGLWGRLRTVAVAVRLVLVLAFGTSEVLAQGIEPMPYEYRDALLGPSYDVQSADINGDGLPDLVLRSRNPFVLAGLPLSIELQWRASFFVLSTSEGKYELDLVPQQSWLDSVLWQSETHELLYGDVDGDGSVEALARALRPGSVSVLLTTSRENGSPVFLQRLNYEDLGVDLGEPELQVDLYDISGDGLADLVTGHGVELNTAHFSARRQGDTTFASVPTVAEQAAADYPITTLVTAPLLAPHDSAQVNALAAGPVVPGSIIGAFQVTPSGTASYAMALTVPPGLSGMTPQLSIEYNNSAPDTTLGMGMNLNGLSQIARCPSTWRDISPSGVRGPDPVDFDNSDLFCLDGQKLVTNGTYGAINQTYATELATFSRIKSVGGSARAPLSWTVQTKAGLTMTYGGTGAVWNGNGENGTYVWLLTRTEDTVGNVIDYEYEFPGSTSYRIQNIRYGGNPGAGIAHKLRISFVYANRNGYQPRGYMYGSIFSRAYVLNRIEAYVTDSSERMVRSWNFTYHAPEEATSQYPPGTTRPPCRYGQPCQQPLRVAQSETIQAAAKAQSLSRYAMTSIQECAGSAGSAAVPCLPSTTFAWAPAIGAPSGALVNSNAGTFTSDHEFSNGDVNGDGFTDLLAVRTAAGVGSVQVFPKDGVSTSSSVTTSLVTPRPNKKPKWVTGDFNGDGVIPPKKS